MGDLQFSSANVRIRTYEGQLLNDAFYERLFATKHVAEMYTILQETSYGDFLDEAPKRYSFEQVLIAEQKRMYQTLYKLTPVRELVDFFTLKHDYHNLKVLIKEEYIQQDLSHLLVEMGSIPLTTLKELVTLRQSEKVDDLLNECVADVYQYIEGYGEAQAIDIIFDNYYWRQMTKLSQEYGDSDLIEWVQRSIDVFNISTILRSGTLDKKHGFLRAVLSEEGTLAVDELLTTFHQSLDHFYLYLKETPYQPLVEGSFKEYQERQILGTFDVLIDNFLMKKMREKKIIPFGPAAIMGYIHAKEIEIKNLRILFIGKINQVPETLLRERVRESYV